MLQVPALGATPKIESIVVLFFVKLVSKYFFFLTQPPYSSDNDIRIIIRNQPGNPNNFPIELDSLGSGIIYVGS